MMKWTDHLRRALQDWTDAHPHAAHRLPAGNGKGLRSLATRPARAGARQQTTVDQLLRRTRVRPGLSWCDAVTCGCFDETAQQLGQTHRAVITPATWRTGEALSGSAALASPAPMRWMTPRWLHTAQAFIWRLGGENGLVGFVEHRGRHLGAHKRLRQPDGRSARWSTSPGSPRAFSHRRPESAPPCMKRQYANSGPIRMRTDNVVSLILACASWLNWRWLRSVAGG